MTKSGRARKIEVVMENRKEIQEEPQGVSPKQLLRELREMRDISMRELERTREEVRRWTEHLADFSAHAGREIARIRRKQTGAE